MVMLESTIFQIMLHLWVMVVLLTYQPEIHGPDHFKQPQAPDGRR